MNPRETSQYFVIFALTLALLAPAALSAQVYDSDEKPELNPETIPKYVAPLVIPPAMPRTGKIKDKGGKNIDYYEIAQRQFQQQILPAPMPSTTVWSYGSVQFPGTVAEGGSFNYPAFTIESKWQKPARVKWINDLVDADGNYLPHLLPVDQTLHWANPVGDCKNPDLKRDCRGTNPSSYTGPVPMIVHVHGAETTEWSDGYPEAWYLPAATNMPGYIEYTSGSFYDTFREQAEDEYSGKQAIDWGPGYATFEYANDQEATTLWYHDHSLGMTRLNVYAGPAGFYLLRGGPGDEVIGTLPGPAPALGDLPGMDYYEIPIVIQDRSFYTDGSLAYPDNRAFFEGLNPVSVGVPYLDIPFIPDGDSDVSPIWLPEFFGNTLVTNGTTWPNQNVEPRRYRLRFLNGSQSRFLILQFSTSQDGDQTSPAADVGVWQIGAEQGFLPYPVNIGAGATNGIDGGILLGPAERADMIIDFSDLPVGTTVYLRNFAPDDPFGGGTIGDGFDAPNPNTTGQVMSFTVGSLKSTDLSTPAADLMLPAPPVLGPETGTTVITLNELESETVCVVEDGDSNVIETNCTDGVPFGPTEARLGILDGSGEGVPLGWGEEITENPGVGDTQVWEIYNLTADAHPIHIHLIQFQVIDRQELVLDGEEVAKPVTPADGTSRGPEVWETGYKDTVISYPGEVTRVKAIFPLEGLFVWHCHILEHEDNEMMRPYCVGDSAACAQHNNGN